MNWFKYTTIKSIRFTYMLNVIFKTKYNFLNIYQPNYTYLRTRSEKLVRFKTIGKQLKH